MLKLGKQNPKAKRRLVYFLHAVVTPSLKFNSTAFKNMFQTHSGFMEFVQ